MNEHSLYFEMIFEVTGHSHMHCVRKMFRSLCPQSVRIQFFVLQMVDTHASRSGIKEIFGPQREDMKAFLECEQKRRNYEFTQNKI